MTPWQTESKASPLRLTAIQPNISAPLCSVGFVDVELGSAVELPLNDMFTQRENDDSEYDYRACQSDFDAF